MKAKLSQIISDYTKSPSTYRHWETAKHEQFLFDDVYDLDIIDQYLEEDSAYRAMYYDIDHIMFNKPRHQIVSSQDPESCLRYFSFIINNNQLTVNFHYRSMNTDMMPFDRQYANYCVKRFLLNKKAFYGSITINFFIDEYLTKY